MPVIAGAIFTLEAAVYDDWFDVNVANELNKIIKGYGNEKQLFFTSDGYQEGIVFIVIKNGQKDSNWKPGWSLWNSIRRLKSNFKTYKRKESHEKARNQVQIGREPLSHYVIRSEIYLSWLFAFFAICSTGLLIYSIVIEEALWAILFLLFVSIVMAIAAFNIGLWKVEVNDMEITYRSTFGRVRKYYFADITRVCIKRAELFGFT